MEDYVSRNWLNCVYEANHGCDEAYHFADVSFHHNDYSRSYVGTSDHDVVSAINAAILVLKGQPALLALNKWEFPSWRQGFGRDDAHRIVFQNCS